MELIIDSREKEVISSFNFLKLSHKVEMLLIGDIIIRKQGNADAGT
jgi:ERCC4-type nuclease